MSTHIGIIGKSGSGKSTIAMGNKDLGIIGLKDLGCHIAVSHTSRPKRDGEIDGVDYHFVDNQTILDMKDRGELFNFHERFGVLYAMTLKEMNCASIVVGIFDHEGIDTLLSYDSSSFIVWVDIDETDRENRIISRDGNDIRVGGCWVEKPKGKINLFITCDKDSAQTIMEKSSHLHN